MPACRGLGGPGLTHPKGFPHGQGLPHGRLYYTVFQCLFMFQTSINKYAFISTIHYKSQQNMNPSFFEAPRSDSYFVDFCNDFSDASSPLPYALS